LEWLSELQAARTNKNSHEYFSSSVAVQSLRWGNGP
jgi:hypothetical protein